MPFHIQKGSTRLIPSTASTCWSFTNQVDESCTIKVGKITLDQDGLHCWKVGLGGAPEGHKYAQGDERTPEVVQNLQPKFIKLLWGD